MAGAPRPLWGWHRLRRSWASWLVAEAGVAPGELVLDVGAGFGALTDALLDAGASVVAVELHRGRAQALRDRFAGRPVVVVQADAADLRLPRRPFRVVANPPFAVTRPLLTRLLAPGTRMQAAHLVVSRSAAQQWSAPDAPGASRWGQLYRVSTGGTIPRRAFVPQPPREAKLLVVRRRQTESPALRPRHPSPRSRPGPGGSGPVGQRAGP